MVISSNRGAHRHGAEGCIVPRCFPWNFESGLESLPHLFPQKIITTLKALPLPFQTPPQCPDSRHGLANHTPELFYAHNSPISVCSLPPTIITMNHRDLPLSSSLQNVVIKSMLRTCCTLDLFEHRGNRAGLGACEEQER